jgi:hypothetical protein
VTGGAGLPPLDHSPATGTVMVMKTSPSKFLLTACAASLLFAACSSNTGAPETTTPTSDPAVTQPTTEGASVPPADAAGAVAAISAELAGPITVKVTSDGEELVLSETSDGRREGSSVSDGNVSGFRAVDGKTYLQAPTGSSFAGRWFELDEKEIPAEENPRTMAFDDLVGGEMYSAFDYTIEDCLASDPEPARNGDTWVLDCDEETSFAFSFDGSSRMSRIDVADWGSVSFTYEADPIEAPTDLIVGEEFEAFKTEMLTESARSIVTSKLEAYSRNGQAIWAANTTLSDTQVADDAMEGNMDSDGVRSVREGANGIRVTVETPDSKVTCTGSVTFTAGTPAIDDITCK